MTGPDTDLKAFLFTSMSINKLLAAEEPAVDTDVTATIATFSSEARAQAAAMGSVYELLYCLENSIRELVETTLKEAYGVDGWWDQGVEVTIRKSAERRRADDEKARWHGPRGGSLLSYVDFPQYGDIIVSQWGHFEALLGDQNWVNFYFAELNRTRRALAHTGTLTAADVERMEVRVRDWLRVVG